MTVGGFPLAEFEGRWERVLRRVDEASLDALMVTTKVNIQYLTGHDAEGAYAAPYALIVAPDVARTCVVRAYNERSVALGSIPLDLVTYFGRRDMVRVWADTVERLGLSRARIGLELDHWGLAPADVAALREALPHADLVDASRLVTRVAEVKSPAELELMREVARVTDTCVEAFHSAVRPGMSEIEAARTVEEAAEALGSRTKDMTLLFGDRTALPHGHVTERRLEAGDVAFIEVSGYLHDYAVGLCRTAVLGEHRDAEVLHRLAEDATEATLDALRPGATGSDVHRAAWDVVEAAGRGATFLQRTGYAIGIGWYDRGYMSLEPGADEVIEEGMTFHMPRILFDEAHRFGVGTSESALVTADGAEVFSRLERGLYVA